MPQYMMPCKQTSEKAVNWFKETGHVKADGRWLSLAPSHLANRTCGTSDSTLYPS
jgi:hypothetical protein